MKIPTPQNTCCFFGHRTIKETITLEDKLTAEVEKLITEKNVFHFLFGSKSQFNDLSYKVVTQLKGKYPQIKRTYVRAEFPVVDEEYNKYLLQIYEDTYFPNEILGSNKAIYIKRNYNMIDNSKYCVIYYNENYNPKKATNSGSKIAYAHAVKKRRHIINVF